MSPSVTANDDGARNTAGGDLLDALPDEPILHRRRVDLLQQGVDLLHGGLGDLREHLRRVFIPRLHAVEVEDRQAAELSHLRREVGVDDAIHRRGEEGDLERRPVDGECDVDFGGVHRHAARDQGHLIEPVRAPGPLASAQFELHLEILQERPGSPALASHHLVEPPGCDHHIWWVKRGRDQTRTLSSGLRDRCPGPGWPRRPW